MITIVLVQALPHAPSDAESGRPIGNIDLVRTFRNCKTISMMSFSRSIALIGAIFASACGPMPADESKVLWGPIEVENWRLTATTGGRGADEADVKAGRAVFFIDGISEPYSMPLPSLARWTGSDMPEELVVIIQAEVTDRGEVLGVRPLSGGNAVVALSEVEVLNSDEEFR